MKTEQGSVIEIIDNIAKIKVGRHSDCSNCGACSGNDSVIISVNNKIGAKVGDKVTFEMKEVNVLKGAFIVFILPLIIAFIGVIMGGLIGKYMAFNINVSQTIGGITAFLLSMIFVKLFDRAATISEKSKPEIIEILL